MSFPSKNFVILSGAKDLLFLANKRLPAFSRLASSILLIFAFSSVSAAQKRSTTAAKSAPADPDRLIALKCTGTTRYTDQEILAASGLQLGRPATDADFKEAVQSLGNSGLFKAVSYTYSSSDKGVKLELQIADADKTKLVPAHFENFVWFTDDELLAALRPRVPLFKQLLPLTGNLSDRVTEALQALLTEKHLPGRVSFLREGDLGGGALHGINYQVEEVDIRIHDLAFPGASPEQTALLASAAHHLIGAVYARTSLTATASFDLLPVYLQRGFLKASFAMPDARVLARTASSADQDSTDLQVDAILPVTPGKVYAISRVDWKGNSALPIAELASQVHLPPGQPADAVRLAGDIETLRKLYRSRGYMTVTISSNAVLNDEKNTVHYDLNIAEGDLYKMGGLEILGLDTQTTARMRAAWTLREGQPYNAEYPKKYLRDTGPLLPRGLDWAVTTHETPDAKDKTVDVEIRFKQR
jgi:outer membrane protein insertion porin family